MSPFGDSPSTMLEVLHDRHLSANGHIDKNKKNQESNVTRLYDVQNLLDTKPDLSASRFIIVMGVSGTGKSTVGVALSKALRMPFIDGDDLHPKANVAKMSRGEPLDDADRQPWLDIIRKTAVARILGQLGVDHGEEDIEPHEKPKTDKWLTEYELSMIGRGRQPSPVRDEDRKPGVIIACSALKRKYRTLLRGAELSSSSSLSALDSYTLPTYFVYLKGERGLLMDRMKNRQGHFMKANMLDSQLKTLESPEGEPGVVTVSVELSTQDQMREIIKGLNAASNKNGA